jgi:hypothetical protein
MEENSKILGTPNVSWVVWLAAHIRYWTTHRLVRNFFTAPRPICLLCDQEEQAINISDPLVSSPENFVFSSRGKWGWASAHLMRVGLLHGSATLAEKVLNPRSMDTDDCVLNRSSPRLATALVMAGEEATAWGLVRWLFAGSFVLFS